MHPFSLSTVKEVDLAIRAHARDPNTAFIAGGTDLMGLMKDRVVLPQHLVDINHLPGLDQIELLPDGGFRMGALVRMSDVAVTCMFARARRWSRRPCYFPPQVSSGTWRPWAEILCRELAAPIFVMAIVHPATSGHPGRGALLAME